VSLPPVPDALEDAHRGVAAPRPAQLSLAEVAGRVGYQAEAAFSRAFKRLLGTAPGAYRQSAAGAN